MATMVLNDGALKITTKAPGATKIGIVELSSAHFFERVYRYQAAASIKSIECIQDATDSTLYHYKVETADGRLWVQTLRITSGQETQQTFNVSQAWKLSEFIATRDVRDSMDSLIRNFGMTECKCEW